MSRVAVLTMTVFVDGDDRDCEVRGRFDMLAHTRGTRLDGDIEVLVDGEWQPLDDVDPIADRRLRERRNGMIEDLLAEQAVRDEADSVCDLDPDEYDDDCERYCA